MISLYMFYLIVVVSLIIISMSIYRFVYFFKNYINKKRKISIKFNCEEEKRNIELDRKDYFNFSNRDLKNAKEYVSNAIKSGQLKLHSTLEQTNELIEKERRKNEEEQKNKSKTSDNS